VRYYMISLGCPKNVVDAEGIGVLLDTAGHQPVFQPEEADILLVNTCGFIESARDESIQVLGDLSAGKRTEQRLFAVGCFAQRDGALLAEQVPGIDGVLGTRRWAEILSLVDQMDRQRTKKTPVTMVGDPSIMPLQEVHRVAVQGSSAYLKIADGCSAACA